MKIILKEDVANLGYKDDVVEVKNGYGRNYLIPTGKAKLATESALKMHEESLRQRAHKIAKAKADAEAAAKGLEGISLVIPAKVSSTGTIYGSVGAQQIAEALEQLGHQVDRKTIRVKENVKELGKYMAHVNLHKDVTVEIPFEVINENPEEQVVEEEQAEVVEAPVEEPIAEEPAAEPETEPAE